MRAKDCLENNRKVLSCFEEIDLILADLYRIRHDINATKKYYDQILNADIRYSEWVDEYQEWKELHRKYGASYREPEYIRYEDEIDKNIVLNVREELLRVVEADESFGYITCLLLGHPSCDIDTLKVERSIREDLMLELNVSYNRIRELENSLGLLPKEENSSELLPNEENSLELLQKEENSPLQTEANRVKHNKCRTLKVTTDVLVEILNQLKIGENVSDKTKIARFISYITDYSKDTIRQRLSNKEELTSSHLEEIEFVNKLLKDINSSITISCNNRR